MYLCVCVCLNNYVTYNHMKNLVRMYVGCETCKFVCVCMLVCRYVKCRQVCVCMHVYMHACLCVVMLLAGFFFVFYFMVCLSLCFYYVLQDNGLSIFMFLLCLALCFYYVCLSLCFYYVLQDMCTHALIFMLCR